jgi:hypothetical protein
LPRGQYIGKIIPPWGKRKNISLCHLGEKILKGKEKKRENVKEKWKTGEGEKEKGK